MDADFRIESRFTLEVRVGRGASGEVYRAIDGETGVLVAVKRFLPSRDDPQALDRFRREARLLAQIDDPHVVRYIAHGVDDTGLPCLVVEWLEGEDLSRRQKRERLDVADALDVAWQAAMGLVAVHRAGIVHRDVKPANIFLVPEGDGRVRAKLIDLGIARSVGESTLTTAGLAIGTPSYMSPEQVRGEERITARADQFSLGVVLFELIAGRRPFMADDHFAVLAKIVLTDPPRLRDLVPQAPASLDALIHRALKKDPLDRFPTARDLADAIASITPFHTVPPPPLDLEPGEPTTRASVVISSAVEQRIVTAVFAGFPQGSSEDATRVFTSIAEDQGGACHGTLGGRVIAIFGGARSVGDEPLRAARAALTAAEHLPGARFAIATGRALAGLTGLSGDIVERGAHAVDAFESARPRPLSIRVDDATARLLAEHFIIQGDLLAGVRPAAAAPRTLVGKVTPLVGRDRELSSLEAAFHECVSEGVSRAVVVTGPMGIGKSRLRYELLDRVARVDPRPLVLVARGSPIAADSALGLLAAAVRRFAGILDGEPTAEQWRKLSARVGRRLSARAAALLGELASVPDAEAEGARPRRDAMLTGDLMRAAWIEWLEAECAERPVVLVLEDLHWGDRASVNFVGAALRALPEQPLFVVGLGRPEAHDRFPGSWIADSALGIRLGPLTAKASERLVRAALGTTADVPTVQRIVTRAEGNAFYLEELIRAVSDGAGEALPDTVLGMVQARLDALGAEAKRVVRAASFFGQTFWKGGVVALLGESPRATTEALARLVSGEVVALRDGATFPSEEEYVFRHALLCDAAYAMIPDDDRKVGHRLAGAWLERAGAIDPAILAAHFDRGEDGPRAAIHHVAAAEKALAGNDFPAAIAHASRGVASGASGEDRGRARLIQAEAHRWRGELAQAEAAATEAASLLPSGGVAYFHAAREAIAANGRLGRFDQVTRWAAEVIACAGGPEVAGARLAALAPAAGQMIYAGDIETAARLLIEIERISEGAGKLDPAVAARLHQVRALLADHERDLEAALGYHEAALDRFERAGDRRGACLTLANTGFIHGSLGSFPEAEDALRRAHATASRMGLGTIAPLALHNLGGVLASQGRLEEARSVEEEAVRAFAAAGDPRLEGASRVYLSRILLAMRDAPGAEAEARRVAESPATPAPLRAGALAALARALLAAGRVADALAASNDASAQLAALGAVEDFETLIGLARAETLFASGDREGAKAAISEAWSRVLSRAARLQAATRAGYLELVPDNARCLALAKMWGVLDEGALRDESA